MITEKYTLGKDKIANNDQKIAIDKMIQFIHSDIEEFVLQGKAGTGKTTIVKKIVEYYNKTLGYQSNSVVAATISHAAKNVLRASLGYSSVDVVTVAKLLGMKQRITEKGEIKFEPDTKTWKVALPPIKWAKLLIIDECSMISASLLSLIREHKNKGTKVIFMGDWHQLPPIDSNRLEDEDSPTFSLQSKAVLKERMRQKHESPIIPLSDIYADNIDNYIETGDLEQFPLKISKRLDVYNPITEEGVIFQDSFVPVLTDMIKDFTYAYQNKNPNYVKAIAYRNKNKFGNAPYNIGSINVTVRKHLWNTKEQFVIGEIVVANNQFSLNRELLLQNGDSFIVTRIVKKEHQGIPCCILNLRTAEGIPVYNIPVVATEGLKKYISVLESKHLSAKRDYQKWKDFFKFKENFAEIGYGYAITAHKAQGSGYRNVYIFEDDIMGVSTISYKEKSQCLYTAVTRATHKLTIFSSENRLKQ